MSKVGEAESVRHGTGQQSRLVPQLEPAGSIAWAQSNIPLFVKQATNNIVNNMNQLLNKNTQNTS
jgi:hypothetical protein